VARARDVSGLDCEGRFAGAAARAIEVRAGEVFEHVDGVLDLEDIEPLHDMRVATRRLRAAMEVFEPCFSHKPWRKALRQVKALADALGERRDRDVAIEFLEQFATETAGDDSCALADLIADLREEQRRANQELRPFVAPKRLKKLRRRLRKLVEGTER
jgi:CHAD domain-containing protein